MFTRKQSTHTFDTGHVMETTRAFKVLADPARLQVVTLLHENPYGLGVNEIAENTNVSNSLPV
jgi:DNA-binding transcriptional ArsR family regulator